MAGVTRFIFAYLPDLVDPAVKAHPDVGVLTVAGESFVSFVWTSDVEALVEGAFMREVFTGYGAYLRLLVEEEWPKVKDDPRAEGIVWYICRTHLHSNLFVSRVEEVDPTWPPPGEA